MIEPGAKMEGTIIDFRVIGRHGAYVPPYPNLQRLPETRPERRPISPFFAFWIGWAAGGAAVGIAVSLLVGR